MARKATAYGTSSLEETRRRLEEEAARRAQEEAERRAAEQAEKAAEETAKASAEQAQTAAPEQPKQQTPIDPANVNIPDPAHTGMRSKGLPKVRQEDIDKTKFLGDVRTSTLDTQFGVVGENYVAPEYKDFMSKDDQIEHYASRMAYHAAGMGGEGERGAGNTVNVNRDSFKDAKQAVLFSTTMSDAKNQYKLLTDYAEDIGVDPNAFVAEAEKWMKNTYNRDLFSVPQTDSGKIQAANKALGGIGLTNIAGEALDIANTTPQLVIQALRMNPDPDVHDEAYKAIQILQKTQGSKWYGMDLKKDDLGFLDSADLTQSQYNEQAKAFASRFVYADSDNDRNKTAYLSSVQEINAKYGGNKRVHAQMMSLLNKTFEERNPGVAAPDAEAVDAFLEKQAAAMANDPAAAEDPSWAEKLKGAWDGIFGKKEETEDDDSTLDAIIEQDEAEQQELMDGMVSLDEEGNATLHGPAGDVSIGTATVAPEAEAEEVQGPSAPEAPTASASGSLASAMNANELGPLGMPAGSVMYADAQRSSGVRWQSGAKNTAVDRMLAADEPSTVADQAAQIQYDPNMSDEAAMLAWSRGQILDARNYAQIKDYVENTGWLSTYRACQRGYANTDMFGGELTDYEKSTVSNWVKYGKRIGAAMMGLKTEGLNPEMQTLGSMMVANLVRDMDAYIADPNNGFIGGGMQQYDALIEQFSETYGAQVNEIKGLWAKQIEAEKSVILENKKENEAIAEAYTRQAIDGTITPDGIAWLAVNEDDEVDENIYFTAMDDDGYVSAVRSVGNGLFGGDFWKDDEFWKGDSAVATEMRNVEQIGGRKAAKDYQKLLGGVMEDTYLSLSIDAHQVNKTLDEYLGMVGMTMGDVADLSLMKMISAGNYVLSNPEMQQNLDKISIGRFNAAAIGFGAGVKKTGEGFAEGAQIIATDANRDRYAFEIYNKFNSEFGYEFAPRETRKALIAFANSGALSEESKAELMHDLETGMDIYHIAAGYMEHDGFTAFIDKAVNNTQKDLETIQVLMSSLEDDEKTIASVAMSTGSTLSNMAAGGLTTLMTGSPFVGAFVQNASGWADTTEYYATQKGATRGAAAFTSTLQTLALAGADTMGMSDWMDDLFGAKGYYNALKRATIKNPGMLARSLGTATKYGLSSAGQALLTEGFEGGGEHLIERGTEILYDTVKAENEAIQRGEGASFIRPIMSITEHITSSDPVKAGKELLAAAGADGAMGMIMRVATNIIATPFAIGGAGKTKLFASVNMALRMYDGDIAMTEENIGKFVKAVRNDCQNPDYIAYMNKVNQYTQDQRNVAMAILDDTAAPERKAAVDLANQAEIYHKDADAARSAANESKRMYFDLRKRAIAGDIDVVQDVNNARDKWTKAETAFKEADGAWKKAAKEAAFKANEWFSAVREASTGVKAEELGLMATRMMDAQKALAQEIVTKTEAEMEAEAKMEAAIEAEAEAVDVMTDEELDADIAQIIETENAVPNAQAEAAEMGYDEETLNALAEQAEADKQKNAAHKEAIIRNQRNSYESLTARMQQAQELEDTDAYNALGEQRGAVQARLEALGVTLDQETNAPEPTTDTAPARPNAKAPVAPKATTESVSPEPSTTTPAARPASDPAATKAARYESAKDLVTGTTKEQRAEQKAAAQMADNVNAMDADRFIEQNFPDAPEDKKKSIREAFNRVIKNTPLNITADIVQFASRVEKKFGVKVEFVDSLDGISRGEITGNRIKVARDATTGDIVRSVIVHELTHKAEGSGKLYDRLSKMILDMKYKGDQAAMDEDIDQKVADYTAYYKAQNRTDTFGKTEARQEIVADYLGDIVNGNQAMIDRLVRDDYTLAQKIRNIIHDVIDKFTGVKDPQIAQMKKAVRMLDKAIRTADKSGVVDTKTRNQINPGSWYDYSKPFADQVQDWIDGKMPANAPLLVGGTPEVLQKIGISKLPMTINQTHMDYAVNGTKDDHGMSMEMISHLPELLTDPIAIIESATRPDDSVVVLVDATINGKQTVAPITIQTTSDMNGVRIDANHLASTYGKNNAVKLFEEAVKKENAKHEGIGVYYLDKNRASNLISNARLQLPGGANQDGLIHSIFDAGSPVNRKYLEQTETRQFKRWFDGSTIKNEDGSAKIMYRGGGEDIDIFDRKKSSYSNLYGRGFYFTESKEQASVYGDVYSYYLSVKHPLSATSGTKSIKQNQLRAFLEAVAEDEDYGLDNYGYGATVDSVMRSLKGRTDFDVLQDINATCIGDFVAAVELFNKVNGTHYDGIITPTETVVFDSTQIKSATDNIGLFDPKNPNTKYSLPSDNALDAQIRAWLKEQQAEIDAAAENDGVSQQPGRINKNPYIPEAAKEVIDNNLIFRTYKKDSNEAQFNRAMDNVKRNGYDEEVERLLNSDYLGTDDSVEAGALAIAAFESGDGATALSLMAKNELAVREAARTMQATQAFAKMSPTHVMAQIGGEMELKLTDLEKEYGAMADEIKRIARENDIKLKDLRGGDELARLNAQDSFTVPDNKWGVPINEKQQFLIDKYKLNNVARPGLNYNRANTKQRMLEAILSTPDPDADTGNGHTLTERLAWMNKGKPVATMADLRYIADRVAEYAKYSAVDKNSREARVALARALEAYGNITPLTNYQKLRTQRFVNMLLSVPSALRNIGGNLAMNTVKAGTHDTFGIIVDAATGFFTGKRTQAMIDMKERAEGWKAFTEETKNTFRDYFVDKVDTSVVDKGDNKFDQRVRGRSFEHSIPEFARNVEGFLMSFGDRNFWKKAYFNSLAEQQRVAQKNGVEMDWNAAVEQAKADADYATFNEDGFVRNLLAQARQHPALGFVMDMIMPFTGVPTNITKRMVEYSPAGLAWSFGKALVNTKLMGKNFDQKAFVDGVSRGLSGTLLFAIGLGLKEMGWIDLGTGDEEDEKLYNLRAAMGDQYSPFIRIGDEYISLAAFAPSISPVIMGAMAYESLQNDDDMLTALKNASVAAGDMIFDASYMSGLSDLFDQNGSFFENAANTLTKNAISQNMPYNALLGQIANGLDPYVRDTKDKDFIMQALKSGAINKIPIIREWVLNPKYDIAGNPIESKGGANDVLSTARNLVDPLTTTVANDDPTLAELYRIANKTGSSSHIPTFLIKNSGKQTILAAIADEWNVNMDRSVGENNLVLDADERNHYNQMYGDLAFNGTGDKYYRTVGKGVEGSFTGIRDYMNSYAYQYATDEERAKEIEKINKNAKLLTQSQIVIDKGYATYY